MWPEAHSVYRPLPQNNHPRNSIRGDRLTSSDSIFTNKEHLSPRHIPEALPGRETHLDKLMQIFAKGLSKPEDARMRVVQMIGPVGSGKTCTSIVFGAQAQKLALQNSNELAVSYINLKLHGDSRVILYRRLAHALSLEAHSTSLSADELLEQTVLSMRARHRFGLIMLDEVDYFMQRAKDADVFYDLTRLDEVIQPGSVNPILGVIMMARSTGFHDSLDPAELSTLGSTMIAFEQYRKAQVGRILRHRAKDSFRAGAVNDDLIEMIADVTAKSPINGDIRYALDILLFAGEVAAAQGKKSVTPEDVRHVMSISYPSVTSDDVENLPVRGKATLLSLVRALKVSSKPYVKLSEIAKSSRVTCEEFNLPVIENLDEQIDDLYTRGIVDVKSLTQIGISGVPAQQLTPFLEGLMSRLETVKPR
jgi:cell division control protein 6